MWQCIEITGASVFRDGAFHDESVYVIGDRFVSREAFFEHSRFDQIEIIDGSGLLLLPGLTDIHLHGAMSHDITDADEEGIYQLLRYEASIGVTQIVPATLTVSGEQLEAVFSVIGNIVRKGGLADAAWLAGLHMEGPYINVEKRGAQNPAYVKTASIEQFDHLNTLAADAVKIVSLAPETADALSFISELKDRVRLSLAHTTANYAEATAAFSAGASHVTHLYNAMPPFHHRDPGVIGAAFDAADVSVELIADGVHIHPAVIRATFQMFPGRVVLVSDSMRATGQGDGIFDLGGQQVTVRSNRAEIENVSIAGSVTNLFDCLRYAVSIGIPLEAAVYAASEYPASRIGILSEAGTVKPGRRASFILVDRDLNRQYVYVNGQRVSDKAEDALPR
jgi:N-acetylglucosamine-6-phosphate deacetylase